MDFFKSALMKKIYIGLITKIASISLTSLTLFSLPFFYELNSRYKWMLFLILFLIYSGLVFFVVISLIIPYLTQFKSLPNLIFLLSTAIILSFTFAINARYYWAIPAEHNIRLCFDANDETSILVVKALVHPKTNRVFNLISFDMDNYPIKIESGNCYLGKIITFYRHVVRWWTPPGVSVNFSGTPPDGRLSLEANGVESVFYIAQEDDEMVSVEKVEFINGFDNGTIISGPWSQNWFLGLKALTILISAIMSTLFLFCLTEKTITDPKIDGKLKCPQ